MLGIKTLNHILWVHVTFSWSVQSKGRVKTHFTNDTAWCAIENMPEVDEVSEEYWQKVLLVSVTALTF